MTELPLGTRLEAMRPTGEMSSRVASIDSA